jgi:hypothetical protein
MPLVLTAYRPVHKYPGRQCSLFGMTERRWRRRSARSARRPGGAVALRRALRSLYWADAWAASPGAAALGGGAGDSGRGQGVGWRISVGRRVLVPGRVGGRR